MRVQKNKQVERKTDKKKDPVIITVEEDVRIPGTKIILEKGDKIEILSESVNQTISASNDCASIDVNVFENEEGQQFVSGSISFGECIASGINAEAVKKVLDSVVSTMGLAPIEIGVPEEEVME